MAEKKFKGAPFGTQSARFDVSAVHPANKRVGTYTEISYCKRRTSELERNLGPGLYNADRGDFSVRATAERAKGPGWQRAQETARLAKIPHILYREAWENKHFLKTKVGPGTYRIPDFMEELEKKPGSVRGVCESREERFREPQSWTPGPGSYGKGGVPCAALEEKRTRSGGVDMELSSGLKRFPEDLKTCGPCPCTYTLRSCTDILRNRKTSERGPYDLFTGPRDEPIVSGYFAAPKCAAVTPGDYSPESFSEQLFRREKKRHGVFSVLDQYPAMPHDRIYHSTLSQYPRPATFPGPCEYETSPPRSNRSSAHVFSSAQRLSKMSERLQNKNFTSVGPGRYDIAEKGQSKSANGHTSSFSSRTQRYLANLRRDKHTQERLRAINLPLERQSSLTPIGPSLRKTLMSSA